MLGEKGLAVFEENLEIWRQSIRQIMTKEIPVQNSLKIRLDATNIQFLFLQLDISTNVKDWDESSG